MTIKLSDAGIISFLKSELDEDIFRESIISWDRKPYNSDDIIRTGRKSVNMPYKGYIAFVDMNPKANWGHPCLYYFIDAGGDHFEKHRETFPPHFGAYPASWAVLMRYGEKPPHDRYFQVY